MGCRDLYQFLHLWCIIRAVEAQPLLLKIWSCLAIDSGLCLDLRLRSFLPSGIEGSNRKWCIDYDHSGSYKIVGP